MSKPQDDLAKITKITPPPYEMTETESGLLEIVKDSVIKKLKDNEGFSVLLASAHNDGNRMSIYTMDSVEDALSECKNKLCHELKDTSDYVLVFDARFEQNGRQENLLIFQMEHLGAKRSMRVFQFYKLEKSSFNSNIRYINIGNLEYYGEEDAWLG